MLINDGDYHLRQERIADLRLTFPSKEQVRAMLVEGQRRLDAGAALAGKKRAAQEVV